MNKQPREKTVQNYKLACMTYIASMWLFFLLEFILLHDFQRYKELEIICRYNRIEKIVHVGYAIVCFGMFIFGIVFASLLFGKSKGAAYPVHRIKMLKNENFEYLSFLTTVMIPLFAFQAPIINHVIVTTILLIILGSILIKMDLYWANPTLAILGFHIYRAEIECLDNPNGILLITQDKLSTRSAIKWKPVSESVWFVSEVRNEWNYFTKSD